MVTKERIEGVLERVRPDLQADGRGRELEANLIDWALTVSHGNKSKAAELLGVKRSTLGDRIRHCRLDRHASSTTDVVAPAALAS